MESDEATGSPMMTAKDLVIESVKKKVKDVNKFAKPIKNISSTIQYFTTYDQTIYSKVSGEDSMAGKLWSVFGVVVKAG